MPNSNPTASGVVFNFMGNYYKCPKAMQASYDLLVEAEKDGLINIATMEYGQYQPILANLHGTKKQDWLREMGRLRLELSLQPNANPMDSGNPYTLPDGSEEDYLTALSALDAAVRYCFTHKPPLCMEVKSVDKVDHMDEVHSVVIEWIKEASDNTTDQLEVEIQCPTAAFRRRP